MQRFLQYIPAIFLFSFISFAFQTSSYGDPCNSGGDSECDYASAEDNGELIPSHVLEGTFTSLGGGILTANPLTVNSSYLYSNIPAAARNDVFDLARTDLIGSSVYPILQSTGTGRNTNYGKFGFSSYETLTGNITVTSQEVSTYVSAYNNGTVAAYQQDLKNRISLLANLLNCGSSCTALYDQVIALLPRTRSAIKITLSNGTCYAFFKLAALNKRLFIPLNSDTEVTAFYNWARQNGNSYIKAMVCPGVCGDTVCGTGENCSTCPGDCNCPGVCGNAVCDTGETFASCAADCGSNDYGSGTYTDGGVGYYNWGGDGSTPFLFNQVNGKYLIENDVMLTYKDHYHDIAKYGYEQNNGDPRKMKSTDYYKLRSNPDITEAGIKFLLKEIEPEETFVDQIRLVRAIHPKNSTAFLENQSNSIQAVGPVKNIAIASCSLSNGQNCVKELTAMDRFHIEGNQGLSMTVAFDLKGLDKNNLFLNTHTWANDPPPVQTKPFEAKADSASGGGADAGGADAGGSDSGSAGAGAGGGAGGGESFIFDIIVIDANGKPRSFANTRDLHPRQIPVLNSIALGEFLKEAAGDTLTINIKWSSHHFIDYIGLMQANPVDVTMEELPLTKANDGRGKDAFKELLLKDNAYAHIVRGERLEFIFDKPKIALNNDQQDTYFFVSSGFYHGLRTYLYPTLDPSVGTFKKELKTYVDELNNAMIKDNMAKELQRAPDNDVPPPQPVNNTVTSTEDFSKSIYFLPPKGYREM